MVTCNKESMVHFRINQCRMMDPGEFAAAAPKGIAKALRQKDRVRTKHRKVRPRARRRCNPRLCGESLRLQTVAQLPLAGSIVPSFFGMKANHFSIHRR